MRVRPVVDSKYVQPLINMGLRHGKMWDCGNPACPICLDYRIAEQDEYAKLSDEEKSELSFPHITYLPHVKGRANSPTSDTR